MIYFDNAATTYPKPNEVYEALDYANRNAFNSGRGSYKSSKKCSNIIDEVRNLQVGLKRFYSTTMKNYLTSSISLLNGIKKFANQYGFASILKDVKNLESDYMSQLNEINEFLKPRRDNDNG